MGTFPVRLVLVLAVVCSLLVLGISTSSVSSLPSFPLARAVPAPCPTKSSVNVCSEYWTPAGPGMETLTTPIFAVGVAEYNGLFPGLIDLTDVPDANAPFDCAAASYYYTAPAPWGQFCYLSGWQRVVNKENVGFQTISHGLMVGILALLFLGRLGRVSALLRVVSTRTWHLLIMTCTYSTVSTIVSTFSIR